MGDGEVVLTDLVVRHAVELIVLLVVVVEVALRLTIEVRTRAANRTHHAGYQLNARMHAQLGVDALEVGMDRRNRELGLLRDGAGRRARNEQRNDFLLTLGERGAVETGLELLALLAHVRRHAVHAAGIGQAASERSSTPAGEAQVGGVNALTALRQVQVNRSKHLTAMAERQRHRTPLERRRWRAIQFFLITELKLNSIRSCVSEISYQLGCP